MGINGGTPLGTKVKPNARTSNCGRLRVLDDRLVMYLFLFNVFWFFFLACFWAVFLAFLLLNSSCFCVWLEFES